MKLREKIIFLLMYRSGQRVGSLTAERLIRPGDIYEDCSYHPVFCTENDQGDLFGISLIDGTGPRGCSMFHCGPRKLTIAEALKIKKEWTPGKGEVDWDALKKQ